MSLIKEISGSQNNIHDLEKNKKSKKSESAQNNGSVSSKNKSQVDAFNKDSVNISNLAREMLNNPISVDTLKSDIDNIQTLDRTTLKEIHNKLESNFYDKPEVLEKIIDGVIPEMLSVDNVENTTKPGKYNQLQEIQNNIENGKYNSDEVLNTIVDRMLDPNNILI